MLTHNARLGHKSMRETGRATQHFIIHTGRIKRADRQPHPASWASNSVCGPQVFHNTKIYLGLCRFCGADPDAENNKGEKPKRPEEAAHEVEMDSEMAAGCPQQ